MNKAAKKLNKKELEKIGSLFLPEAASFWLEAGIVPMVKIDSRQIKDGDVFVALSGEKTDGHHFISQVEERHGLLVIVNEAWFKEKGMSRENEIGFLVVPDTLKAMQSLAKIYRKKFSVPLIAIGGNSGKTTTKEILASLLSTRYRVLSTEANLNNHIGVPLTLFNLRETTEIAVIEMGMNHSGEIDMLCNIAEPTHGLVTNIGKAHIEFFKDIEDIAESEGELFDYLVEKGGHIFLNLDDERVVTQAKKCKSITSYTTLSSGANAILSDMITNFGDGTTDATVKVSGFQGTIRFSLMGKHNAQNVLAAMTVANHFQVPFREMQETLLDFKMKTSMKRSAREVIKKITLINDTYNSNPDSMRAVMETFSEAKIKGRKIAVIGDMLELGSQSEREHALLGEYIGACGLDALFAYGMFSGIICGSSNMKDAFAFEKSSEEKSKLTEALLGFVKAGDVLLFKGSRGMKMEEVVERFKEHYNEEVSC